MCKIRKGFHIYRLGSAIQSSNCSKPVSAGQTASRRQERENGFDLVSVRNNGCKLHRAVRPGGKLS